MIPWLLLLLFALGVILLFWGRFFPSWAKGFSFLGLLGALVWAIATGQKFQIDKSLPPAFFAEWRISWIPEWGIEFHTGLDGFSFALLLLTLAMGLLAIIVSNPKKNEGAYYAALVWSILGGIGILVALDVFLFFMFWEASLFPIYWLLLTEASDEDTGSIWRFIIFTQASGLLLLISVLGLAYAHFWATGELTFNYQELLSASLSPPVQQILLAGFLGAFLIKLPAFPFHVWMPSLFRGSLVPVVLIGLLVKTAIFGLVRFSWPIFPEASELFSMWMMVLGVFTILYGAIMAFAQTEAYRLLAYGTISHAGLLLIGVFCHNRPAFFGVLVLLVTQALSTAGLLMMLRFISPQTSKIDMGQTGGFLGSGPKFATLFLAFLLSGMGFPGLGGFVGEWLVLWGTFSQTPTISAVASLGIVLGAVYSLWLFQRLCFGKPNVQPIPHFQNDLKTKEVAVFGAVLAVQLAIGLYPGLIVNSLEPPIQSLNEEIPFTTPVQNDLG